MKVLDLFCGTKSIARAFEKRGHEVYTVDWNADFEPTLCADIGKLTAAEIIDLCGGKPDVIWASPDCTTFSRSQSNITTSIKTGIKCGGYHWQYAEKG